MQPAACNVWSGMVMRLLDHFFPITWLNVLIHHLCLLQHETRVLRVKVIAGIDLAKKDIIGARWASQGFLLGGDTVGDDVIIRGFLAVALLCNFIVVRLMCGPHPWTCCELSPLISRVLSVLWLFCNTTFKQSTLVNDHDFSGIFIQGKPNIQNVLFIRLFDLDRLLQSVLSTLYSRVSCFHYIPFTYENLELQVLINDYLHASPVLLITHLHNRFSR